MIEVSEHRIAYKVLTEDGVSIFQGYPWPLPKDDKPGDWLEIDKNPILCKLGFHGYLTLDNAIVNAGNTYIIYEMEVEYPFVQDHEKLAAKKARLTKKIVLEDKIILEVGIRNCLTCSVPHKRWKSRRGKYYTPPSWDNIEDGHKYNPESWIEFVARIPSPDIIYGINRISRIETLYATDTGKPLGAGVSYHPVVPSFHNSPFKPWDKYPDRCGTCGLDKGLHEGWEERAAIAKAFEFYDRWQLLIVIQEMKRMWANEH